MHQYLNFIYSLLIQISKVYFVKTVNGRVTGSAENNNKRKNTRLSFWLFSYLKSSYFNL